MRTVRFPVDKGEERSIIFLELKYAPAKAEIEQDRGGAAPGGAVLPAPDNATFIDAWERESTMKQGKKIFHRSILLPEIGGSYISPVMGFMLPRCRPLLS